MCKIILEKKIIKCMILLFYLQHLITSIIAFDMRSNMKGIQDKINVYLYGIYNSFILYLHFFK